MSFVKNFELFIVAWIIHDYGDAVFTTRLLLHSSCKRISFFCVFRHQPEVGTSEELELLGMAAKSRNEKKTSARTRISLKQESEPGSADSNFHIPEV